MTRPNWSACASRYVVTMFLLTGTCLACGFLAPTAMARAQDGRIRNGHHSRWTPLDGAPTIRSIAQADDGYLWLGTNHGLVSFDGVRFRALRMPASNDVLSREISVVAALPGGGLWIGYESGGASFLQKGKLVTYSAADGLSPGCVRAFAKDRRGTVWAATQYGLVRLRGSRWENVGPHWQYPNEYPDNVFVDDRGTLWTSTRDGLSFLRDGEQRFQVVDSHRLQNVDFSEAPDGTVWLASVTGSVRSITDRAGGYTAAGNSFPFRSEGIHVDRDGGLWITTVDHGLFRVADPENGYNAAKFLASVEHFGTEDGLTNDFAFDVVQGREGELWVATAKGLDQFRPQPFSPVGLLSGSTYIEMATTSTGDVIIGSDRLSEVHGGMALPIDHAPKAIECIYRDPSGLIWLGNSSHLFRLANSKYIPYSSPKSFDKNLHTIQAMTMDEDGALWVSYLHDGVFRLKNGDWERSGGLSSLSSGPAISMLTDSNGRMLFGYSDNRIAAIDALGVVEFGAGQGLDLGTIASFLEVHKRVWVGGTNGLQFEDHGRFRSIAVAGTEELRGVSGIATSHNGDFWLNTSRGIVQLPLSEVEKAVVNPQYRVHAFHFNYLDGLTGDPEQLHHLPTVVSARDGRLYFATQGSVMWLNSSDLKRNTLPPPVWIESATADGTAYLAPSAITLHQNIRSLIIDYTATSLLIPQRVRFRYKLDGIDADWQDAGTRREAIYSRVPPGRYRFQVLASNNDNVWNEKGASLEFVIPPTFVQSITFRLLAGTTIVALLCLLYWLRIEQLTRTLRNNLYARVSEREQIARDLHDTFLQGVQGVLLSFHTATKHFDGSERSRELLDDAFRTSSQVMAEGRELLSNLRGEHDAAEDLAGTLSTLGAEFSKAHGTLFTLAVTGQVCNLHPVVRDEMYRIAREAMTNAFRHAAAAKIEVDLFYKEREFLLRVRDNGIGIDPAILSAGFRAKHWGLSGMRERAKTIGADMAVWSRPQAGTELEIRLPMSVARPPAPKDKRLRLFSRLLGLKDRRND